MTANTTTRAPRLRPVPRRASAAAPHSILSVLRALVHDARPAPSSLTPDRCTVCTPAGRRIICDDTAAAIEAMARYPSSTLYDIDGRQLVR